MWVRRAQKETAQAWGKGGFRNRVRGLDSHIMPLDSKEVKNGYLSELKEAADSICKELKIALQRGENPFFALKADDDDEVWLAYRYGVNLLAKAGLINPVIRLEIAVACRLRPEVTELSYRAYLDSPEWMRKAEAAKERAGQRCQGCNASREHVILDAHHRTYERLGHEEPGDITVLCRRCHQAIHESGGFAR